MPCHTFLKVVHCWQVAPGSAEFQQLRVSLWHPDVKFFKIVDLAPAAVPSADAASSSGAGAAVAYFFLDPYAPTPSY